MRIRNEISLDHSIPKLEELYKEEKECMNLDKSILYKLVKANGLLFNTWATNYESWVEMIEEGGCSVEAIDIIVPEKTGESNTIQSLAFVENSKGEIAEVASILLFGVRWILSYNFLQVTEERYKSSPINLISTPSVETEVLNEIEINEDEDQFEEIVANLKLGSVHLEKIGFMSALEYAAPDFGMDEIGEF